MVLNRHLQKLFLIRILTTTLICFIIASFAELVDVIEECSEVCRIDMWVTFDIFVHGLKFVGNAIFFIVSISAIWLITYLVNTNQMQIISTYSGGFLPIVKNAIIITFYTCIVYALPFDHFILEKYARNKQHIGKGIVAENMWIRNVKITEGTANGEFYLLRNAEIYKTGLTAESLSVYTINNGYLTKYIRHKNIFITKTPENEVIFFPLDNQGEEHLKYTLEHIRFYKVLEAFYRSTSKMGGSFYTNSKNAIINLVNMHKTLPVSWVMFIDTLQICLSLILATIIPFTEMLSIRNSRTLGMGRKIIKTMIYLMVSYTLFEAVKVVNPSSALHQIISVSITAAILLIFLSRFIKIYH